MPFWCLPRSTNLHTKPRNYNPAMPKQIEKVYDGQMNVDKREIDTLEFSAFLSLVAT